MNSQCNGSFAQIQRADTGGNRRGGIQSLLSVSVPLEQSPRSPQNAHVGPRWPIGCPMDVFTPQGPAATWAKSAPFSTPPKIEESLP
jgi:hypothetical protein